MTQVHTCYTNYMYSYHAHRLKHHSKSFIAVGKGATTGKSHNIMYLQGTPIHLRIMIMALAKM